MYSKCFTFVWYDNFLLTDTVWAAVVLTDAAQGSRDRSTSLSGQVQVLDGGWARATHEDHSAFLDDCDAMFHYDERQRVHILRSLYDVNWH